MADKVSPIPAGFEGAIPYLIVSGGAKALDFYQRALGAEVQDRIDGPEGKLMHAELKVGRALFMLGDEFPEMGHRSPKALGGTPITVCVYVEDADAVFAQAVRAGATVKRPVQDQFYGDRSGTFEDPFGHVWNIATHIEDLSKEEITRRAAAMAQG